MPSFDFSAVPFTEDDRYEFKSSLDSFEALKPKIQKAASAFGNSGGGIFLAGLSNTGKVDGGFLRKNGKQSVEDWIDRLLLSVEPIPRYRIDLIGDIGDRIGALEPNRVVIAITFEESHNGPHMAPDNKYYIRAGAHSEPARDYIVEAIRARRSMRSPRLTHLFRIRPDHRSIVQLGIVPLTPAPAINVEIDLFPKGTYLENVKAFPLKVPVVDQSNPFFFDATTWAMHQERFGREVELNVSFEDLFGNKDRYEAKIDASREIEPTRITGAPAESIANSLAEIAAAVKRFRPGSLPIGDSEDSAG